MSIFTLLTRPDVKLKWRDGKLNIHWPAGKLTFQELSTLTSHANKSLIGGWFLLHRLWTAGYTLHLERSVSGDGYVIIPCGQAHLETDMDELFDLYEQYHDAAVDLLLDVCRRLKIRPEEFAFKAAEIVKDMPKGRY